MKIYTKVVMDMTTGDVIEEDSYEYNGEIALCGGGGGRSTSTSAPPSWMKPYYKKLGKLTSAQLDIPLQPYTGRTVAEFTPEQSLAQSMATRRALTGSPIMQGANTEMMRTLRGDYLDYSANPMMRRSFEAALEDVLPNLDASARQAGMYGGSSHELIRGKALADLGAKMYEPERQRQMQALSMSPQISREDYYDIAQLAAVGEEKQAMEQSLINELIRKFEFQQMEPWQRYGMAANILGGMGVGGTTTTQTRSGK